MKKRRRENDVFHKERGAARAPPPSQARSPNNSLRKGEQKNVSYLSIVNTLLNRCNPGSTQDLHPVCVYPLNRFPSAQGEREREMERGDVIDASTRPGRSCNIGSNEIEAHTQELSNVE